MMQKVRGVGSASLSFTEFFHFSFSVPLRYLFYSSTHPFLSPILGRKNDLIKGLSIFGGINIVLLILC